MVGAGHEFDAVEIAAEVLESKDRGGDGGAAPGLQDLIIEL